MLRAKLSLLALFVLLCIHSTTSAQDELRLSFGENGKFELSGSGQELLGLEIISTSRSLIPAETPAPFERLATNLPRLVRYPVDRTLPPLTIDGTIQLDVGWNSWVGGRDISFRYAADLPGEDLDFGDGEGVTGRVNDDGFIVVSGSGQQVFGFDFISPTEMLVPLTDDQGVALARGVDPPGPFGLLLANSPAQVTLAPAPGSSPVTLDSDLTLPVGFSGEDASREVQAQWGGGGAVRFPIDGGIAAPETVFLWVGPIPMAESEYPPAPLGLGLRVELNSDLRFEVHGTGHSLKHLDITSDSGALVPDTSPGPFDELERNHNMEIAYQMNEGTAFVLDGSLTLDSGWQEGSRGDVMYSYGVVGTSLVFTDEVDFAGVANVDVSIPMVPERPPFDDPPFLPPPILNPPALDPIVPEPTSDSLLIVGVFLTLHLVRKQQPR